MDVVTAADSERSQQSQPTLFGVLLVAAALAFVTALIVLSGRLSPAWFLYLVPIVLGALTYEVGGAVLTTALSAVALMAAAPAGSLVDRSLELGAGFVVFLVCGVVVGAQASRQRSHDKALEEASVIDSLTGVLRAEHFIARLGEELSRGERYGHPVGVVYLRVEAFDEFTRVFGHYKAEAMLRHLADIVRLTARDTDTIGRLGTASFGIILPHADTEHAMSVADRIVHATRSAEFEGDALEPVTACVTSAGASCFPSDHTEPSGLLHVAMDRVPSVAEAAS